MTPHILGTSLEAVMNLLRNGLLMRKTGDRRRSDMSEKYAFVCSFSAEFITLSKDERGCKPRVWDAGPE